MKKPVWRVIENGQNYIGTGREVEAKCEQVECACCEGSREVLGAQCFLCEGKGFFRELLPRRILCWSSFADSLKCSKKI